MKFILLSVNLFKKTEDYYKEYINKKNAREVDFSGVFKFF